MKSRDERAAVLNHLADLVYQLGSNDSLVTDALRDALLKEVTGGFLPAETTRTMFSEYVEIRGRYVDIADGTQDWQQYAEAREGEDTVLEKAQKDADWHRDALLDIPDARHGIAPVDYEGAQLALKEAVTLLGGDPATAARAIASAYGLTVTVHELQVAEAA